jgi:hypothetical protein
MIYFFDANGRYIGCRAPYGKESLPPNSTDIDPMIEPDEDAHWIDRKWHKEKRKSESLPGVVPQELTLEDRVEQMTRKLAEIEAKAEAATIAAESASRELKNISKVL